MPATPFLGGTLNLLIAGIPYQLAGSFTDSVGGAIRANKKSISGIAGFTQSYDAPSIDCELIDDGTVSTAVLKSISNAPVTVQYDNGKLVVLSNAWQEGEITINPVEATMKVKFCGLTRTEIPA